ncbi:MAG: hypothetical protein EZS28_009073 [Streblomastix strix]|uniref:Uncharacterized protein n=1 Tax=Streblomastix strix TaxID=222440 RepID=A0A5J4WLY7_9EUKA|nr:MAG: hypothetical protein EZS28_009073 [Streblomastix strix]
MGYGNTILHVRQLSHQVGRKWKQYKQQSVPPAVIEELVHANRPRLDMESEPVGEDALFIAEIYGVIDSIQGAKMKRLTLIQQKLK